MDQLFEQIAQLPLLAQLAVYAGIGWGIAWFARKQAGKEQAPAKTEMVMSGISSITDMKPIRDLVECVKELVAKQERTAIALEELSKAYKESINDRRFDDEVERRVKERIGRQS